MNTIKGVIVNDFYLQAIAVSLHEEARLAEDGGRFKKIIPALAFYCFTLESKLLSYGKNIFIKNREYKKFVNCTLSGKFAWLTKRLAVPDNEAVLKCKEIICEMVTFRNAVTHSKNIDVQEERELIGLERFHDRFVRISDEEKDFMAFSSLKTLNEFSEAIWILDQIWWLVGSKQFGGDWSAQLVGMTRARVTDRDQTT